MKLWTLLPIVAAGLVSYTSHPSSQSADVFSLLAGQWDEQHTEQCESPHVISFDEEKKTMFITSDEAGWVTDNDSRKVFRYDILSANRHTLRAKLENEPRLDAKGNAVVWHIVLVNKNTYCWSRDDWPQGSCTQIRQRCVL